MDDQVLENQQYIQFITLQYRMLSQKLDKIEEKLDLLLAQKDNV